MRVCCLYSGGKDSAYALHTMLLHGFEVPVLLTIRSEDPDSWLYHTPGIEVAPLFENMTGITTEVVHAPRDRIGEERALTEALIDLKEKYDLDAICSGALLSDFQRMRFSHSAMDAELISYTPLWRKDGKRYMLELLEQDFRYILVSYASPGFRTSDLGVEVDGPMQERLFRISKRWGSHPAFEGGEAETLVLTGPLFPKRLEVEGEVDAKGEYRAVLKIKEARIV